MHSALQIPELVGHIVDSLDGPIDIHGGDDARMTSRPAATSSLACLARTSKLFHGYAISKLWSTQVGIQNLIRCMPDDLWTTFETHFSVSCVMVPLRLIELKRAPRSSDWQRFDYYAAHIRELVFPSPEQRFQLIPVSPAVYTVLARYTGHPHPYLPHLRALTFRSRGEPTELSDICMSFLGPSVSSLTVAPGRNDSASSLVALTQAPYLAPTLQRLSIDFRWTPDPSPLLAGALNTLRELRVLRLVLPAKPSNAMWATIAALPSLVELSIEGRTHDESISPNLAPTGISGSTFELSHVTRLYLLNLHATDSAGALHHFDLPELTSLHVTCPTSDGYPGEELLRAIADRCPATLFELSIQPSGEPPAGRIHTGSSARHFRILHAFRGLRKLDVSLLNCIDDDFLYECATAWPALEELALTSTQPLYPGLGATLLGLAYVAESCQSLRTLTLDVDASAEVIQPRWPHDAPPRGSRPNMKVTTLDVGASLLRKSDAPAVAAVLVESFACLSAIRQKGSEPAWAWRKVEELLSTLYATGKDTPGAPSPSEWLD